MTPVRGTARNALGGPDGFEVLTLAPLLTQFSTAAKPVA